MPIDSLRQYCNTFFKHQQFWKPFLVRNRLNASLGPQNTKVHTLCIVDLIKMAASSLPPVFLAKKGYSCTFDYVVPSYTVSTKVMALTKISSCRVNTASRWSIKQLGISFGSISL